MTDIFISYSHQDEVWKDKLQAPLRALQLHNDFEVWDDRQIELGENWLPAIENAIEQARVAVLLVSNDFLTSDFVVRKEIPRLLQRRADQGLKVVPVVVRPCPWQYVPWLAALQGATKDNEPLTSLQTGHEEEAALSQIAGQIFHLLQEHKQAEQQALQRQREAEERKRQQEEQQRAAEAQQRCESEARERRIQEEKRQQQRQSRARQEEQQKAPTEQVASHKQHYPEKRPQQAQLKGLGNKTSLGLLFVLAFLGGFYGLSQLETAVSGFRGDPPAVTAPANIPQAQQEAPPVLAEPKQAELPEKITLPYGLNLIRIPAGSFQMGSESRDDEKPVHAVNIAYDFYMGETEITFAQYDAYAQATGKKKPVDEGWGRDNRPVINVSWDDAQGYIQWLNRTQKNALQGLQCRLPSEAEWEYAARSGTKTKYFWGNDIGKNNANCDGCGSQWDDKQTAPVRSFVANDFGLYDMHGNLWEWVQDRWHDNYQSAPDDGSAWQADSSGNRVLRGGSWIDSPFHMRSANRNPRDPEDQYYHDGFRIVCSPPSEN